LGARTRGESSRRRRRVIVGSEEVDLSGWIKVKAWEKERRRG
jgi:hypothetical protein